MWLELEGRRRLTAVLTRGPDVVTGRDNSLLRIWSTIASHLLSELSRRPAIISACAEESIVAPLFIAPILPDLPADKIIG